MNANITPAILHLFDRYLFPGNGEHPAIRLSSSMGAYAFINNIAVLGSGELWCEGCPFRTRSKRSWLGHQRLNHPSHFEYLKQTQQDARDAVEEAIDRISTRTSRLGVPSTSIQAMHMARSSSTDTVEGNG